MEWHYASSHLNSTNLGSSCCMLRRRTGGGCLGHVFNLNWFCLFFFADGFLNGECLIKPI